VPFFGAGFFFAAALLIAAAFDFDIPFSRIASYAFGFLIDGPGFFIPGIRP
jgi:hypothetical protein